MRNDFPEALIREVFKGGGPTFYFEGGVGRPQLGGNGMLILEYFQGRYPAFRATDFIFDNSGNTLGMPIMTTEYCMNGQGKPQIVQAIDYEKYGSGYTGTISKPPLEGETAFRETGSMTLSEKQIHEEFAAVYKAARSHLGWAQRAVNGRQSSAGWTRRS